MILSQREQDSGFDVLHSQKEPVDPAVHVIQINKKIGDTGFQKTSQPTELTPVIPVEQVITEDSQESVVEKYVAPKALVDYIDTLIIKNKLPLRTLKFDIEYSKSKKEIARIIQKHVETINNISSDQVDHMFTLVGVGKEKVVEPEEADVTTENIQSIPEVQDSVGTPVVPDGNTVEKTESVPVSLDMARETYSDFLTSYYAKLQKDQAVFRMMISQLGGNKEMPQRPVPAELLAARKEYYDVLANVGLGTEDSVSEYERLLNLNTTKLSPKARIILQRAVPLTEYYSNLGVLADSLILADPNAINAIVDQNGFDGLRVKKEELKEVAVVDSVSNESVQAVVAPAPAVEPAKVFEAVEVVKPESPLVQNDSSSVVEGVSFVEISHDIEKKEVVDSPQSPVSEPSHLEVQSEIENVSPSSPTDSIKVDLIQNPADFVPKVFKKEEAVSEKKQEDVVSEPIIQKAEEKPPVDSTVAESSPSAQNVFPTEFEDKRLEVHHGFPGKPNEIKVFYDGKEIAKGEVGKKVTINKGFKSGFLLADTQEERALKYSHTIIKTLKPVKM